MGIKSVTNLCQSKIELLDIPAKDCFYSLAKFVRGTEKNVF